MFNKFSVIITAGGTSSRYGNTNKLLEKIKDKTVIEETVSKFVDFENIEEIIISANNSIMDIFCLLYTSNQPDVLLHLELLHYIHNLQFLKPLRFPSEKHS